MHSRDNIGGQMLIAQNGYVLHLPGTTQYRLRADESGVDNLYLAGDWVRTGLNAGCVEAAVMGGIQAARAILDDPRPVLGATDT